MIDYVVKSFLNNRSLQKMCGRFVADVVAVADNVLSDVGDMRLKLLCLAERLYHVILDRVGNTHVTMCGIKSSPLN